MKYKKFFGVMLVMVLLASISALIPTIFLVVWEKYEVALTWQRIFFLISIIAASKLLAIALTIFRENYAKGFNERNFRSMLYSSLEMDYDTIITMGPANILERITDSVNKIYFYMTGDYIDIWASILTILVCLGLTSIINIKLALLLFAMLPLNYLGYRMLNKELAKRSKELSRQTSEGFQEILSYVQQVDYMKQTADYSPIFKVLSPSIDKLYRSMARVNIYAQSVSEGLCGLNDIVKNFILMTIVYNFFAANFGPYTLMLTTIILPLYFSSIGTVVGAKLNQNGFKVARDYQTELESHQENNGDKSLGEIRSIQYNVNGLTLMSKTIPFSAHGVLKNGDIAQICGPSGCGKSTFAKALLKFRVVEGLKINGIAIAEIDKRQLRSKIEYLSQNVPIFSGTLANNLFLNCDRTKETEYQFLHEPILQSIFATKTFESEILEGGANLSGGEKQKIALARALAGSADVLILDEVCSNIDRESAEEIYKCLHRERSNRITIIISHDELPEGLVNVRINSNLE